MAFTVKIVEFKNILLFYCKFNRVIEQFENEIWFKPGQFEYSRYPPHRFEDPPHLV